MYRYIPKVLICCLLFSAELSADSWGWATPRVTYSADSNAVFQMIPARLWNANDRKLDHTRAEFSLQLESITEPIFARRAFGALYVRTEDGKFEHSWTQQLSNFSAPVTTMVSDSGHYVITFDNHGSIGFGENMVAIYGYKGRNIANFALNDFMAEEDIDNLLRSVSSRSWKDSAWIQDDSLLLLKLLNKPEPMIIELPTGAILTPLESAEPKGSATEIDTIAIITKMLTRNIFDPCPIFNDNAAPLIQGFFERMQFDSIQTIIEFIKTNCRVDYTLDVTQVLVQIANNTFDELHRSGFYIMPLIYLTSPDYPWESHGRVYKRRRSQSKATSLFLSKVNRRIARSLIESQSPGTIERLLVSYFAGDIGNIYDSLKSDTYAGTLLAHDYRDRVNLALRMTSTYRLFWEATSGIWQPFDKDDVLGAHWSIGGNIGLRTRRFEFALAGDFRFFKSASPYFVEQDGVIKQTQEFLGGYLGLEGGPKLISSDRMQLSLFLLSGVDGFDAISSTDGEDGRTLLSFATGGGARLRFFFGEHRTKFIGLTFRYHVIDYNTKGGSDLSGNAISLSLGYGYMKQSLRHDVLQDLSFYD